MSSNYEPLPIPWVERIFERMNATYGVQKMAAMWTGVGQSEVKATWAQALGAYPRSALLAAVEAMPSECGVWPPTLPEFIALVRSKVPAPEHRRALPLPNRTKDEVRAGAEQMAKIRAMLATATKRMP
jgi:hypothetical protein